MADLLHKSYGIGLSVSYCILFALGVFMGASWGIGTLIAVFVYGPVIDQLLPYFKPYTYKIAGMTDEKMTKNKCICMAYLVLQHCLHLQCLRLMVYISLQML